MDFNLRLEIEDIINYPRNANKLSEKVIDRIKSNDSKLISLSLSGKELLPLIENREKCEDIGALIGSNTHLKSLQISFPSNHRFNQFTVGNYDLFLRGVANNRSITTLDLRVPRDSSNAVEIMAPVFENNAMETIKFNNCNGIRAQQLAKALIGRSKSKLKVLRLVGSRYAGSAMNDAVGAILITILDNMDCIEELHLDRSAFDKKTCLALKGMLTNPCCKLKKLTLKDNQISSEGYAILGLIKNKTLKELDLSESNRVSSGGWKHFFSMLKPNKLGALRILHLDNNNMTDEGVIALSNAFVNSTTLVKLFLNRNISVTSTGWQALASLVKGNPRSELCTISIRGNNDSFDDDAVFVWVDALQHNTKLDSLSISSQGVTSKGWSAFQNLICNKTSVDTIYDSNHTISITTEPRDWAGAPRNIASLMETCERYRLSSSLSRILDDITAKAIQRITGLQKIFNFYFKHGNANMQELMEMDLNVLVFAIGSIASCRTRPRTRGFFSSDYEPVEPECCKICEGISLMYKLIRSMPSLLDLSSLATLKKDVATATNA